ncbi:multi-sensor hybrid histidine kinase [Geobacter metallireducens RCH3]|uniref:histidine kinase n=1 Tax=Geobacter metallireducens (strain ATCC 53774 / DSM 7210 / GS-15) TaxID=269799 RepID=Q39SB3_GEOMG|nr:response regulator [Geobacter metallireducens]ABB32861.1 sensor histidine kinase response receiver, 4HB_MCP_1 and GAF domain-containing [Geobacter metallireducens GS-15]EHP89006.1 multi-sensor hybrid histidine kinase [Geobacter metallireducens RCH3]
MGWYADLKIRNKLLLGYGTVIAFSSLIGYFGVTGLTEMKSHLDAMHDHLIPGIETAAMIDRHHQQHRRTFLNYLEENRLHRKELELKLHHEAIDIQESLKRYAKLSIYPAERRLLDDVITASKEYMDETARLKSAADSGADYETLTVDNAHLRTLFGDVENRAKLLTQYSLKEGDEHLDQSTAGYFNIRSWLISLLLGAIAIALAMAFFITRSVADPIRVVLDAVRRMEESGTEKARLAEAIAAGDLTQDVAVSERLRIDPETVARDEGGMMLRAVAGMSGIQASLDAAFSRMTDSLRRNRQEEQARDWLKSGANELGAILRGDRRLEEMVEKSLSFLCEYLGAGVGVLYLYNDRTRDLEIAATYALARREDMKKRFALGEGLVGEAAKERRIIRLADVPPGYLPISSAIGEAKPLNIAAVPLLHDNLLVGVVEIGSFREFTARELEFLSRAQEGLSIGINVNRSRKLVDELLEQTQAQTEELRVQQEELQQTNEELEERAQMLEQQREQIRAKNREVEETSRALKLKADELERISTYKSEFLANMSHELRTPLNSLLILSSLLKENREHNLTDKQVEYAATINSSGNDLLTLINDILDLSKIESGRLEFNYEQIPLRALFDQLRTMFSPLAEQKGLDFDAIIEEGVPEEITTDGQRTQQILKNLVSNACKFTREGRVAVRAHLPNSEENPLPAPAIAIQVSDTGIGISPDKHDLVFQAFQQADGTTSRKFGGTGLGLSISRQLARGLHGDVLLESEEGKGSSFTLYLPLDHAAHGEESQTAVPPPAPRLPPVTVPRGKEVSGREADVQLPTPVLADDREKLRPGERSILIIEDDLSFAAILMDMVRDRGFPAMVAGDGESGIALADHYLPSAIVLDVMLPHIDGWGVMKCLKDSLRTRHIPVHFLTCLEDRQKALTMGAIGFVTKPVNSAQLDEVFSTIEHSLAKSVRKLLIVEDDRNEAKSMEALLGVRDVAITVTATGSEAMGLLAVEPFDCIVLDLGLSDMSGFEVLEKIQSLDESRRIPVIIHSGRDLSREDEQRLRNYAESIIIKGAKSPERLLNEVSLFLHLVESGMGPEKKRMIRAALDDEALLEGKKVLIVDDDMRNIFSLSSVLAEKKMIVLEAENGREALERLNGEPGIDVVLMDIMMPEMDGFAATRAIRKDPRFARLPIIALTAKAMKGDRDECLKAGASDYIQKPVDADKLLSLLRVWLYGS